MMNPYITGTEFQDMSKKDRKEWVRCMMDHGATGADMAEILGVPKSTMNLWVRKLGFKRNQGRRCDRAYKSWNDFCNCYPDYDPHAEPNYDKVNEEYELSDADFEGFASSVVDGSACTGKGDPIITTEPDLEPESGTLVFYGTAAQIAEAFWKRMPQGKIRVIVTWGTDALN